MDEMPPPWSVLPDLDPWLAATQGSSEWYFGLQWLPFWQALTSGEEAA